MGDGALRDKRGLPPRVAGLMRTTFVLLELLDEITRRELRIDRALMAGDQAEVLRLVDGKSSRHLAHDAYIAAERAHGAGSKKAADLFQVYEDLSKGVDVTAEDEDDFDPDVDLAVARMLVEPQRTLEASKPKLAEGRG